MKAIIVGASSGIGRAVAERLLHKGWQLGIAARREDLLQDLARQVTGQVTTMRIDVNSIDAPGQLRQLIHSMQGIDLYFHASGIGRQNRELAPDIEINTVQTNALGFTRMVGEAYRYFAEQGKGHIACITSIAGTKGLGPAPSYSATKAFQCTYLQALEQQAHNRGLSIRFTDLRPGFVDTSLISGDCHYPMVLKVDDVADAIVRTLIHQYHVRVFDWRWRWISALWRCVPRCIWRRLKL